eukprot:CAMPEP_0171937434 /NCGR_PEP_ID=MMETSP0993-20121228/34608_1 /TAXON_ID=483369 /ORGANISM="non described non described, Strain CCMP2098" /LENGTH=58 /DNA_ID=CAMNT_0012578785 /DNA_START=98 /DNA_END=270 /DNA_ORIENTATION=-
MSPVNDESEVAKKRTWVVLQSPMGTKADCHKDPWLPFLFQSGLQLVPPSWDVSTDKLP